MIKVWVGTPKHKTYSFLRGFPFIINTTTYFQKVADKFCSWYNPLLFSKYFIDVYFLFNSFFIPEIKIVAYQKACNVVLQSSKHRAVNFHCEFIFVIIMYFIAVILPKNVESLGFLKSPLFFDNTIQWLTY